MKFQIFDSWCQLTYGFRREDALPASKIKRVKFSDGLWETALVRYKTGTYYDMGQVYDYKTEELCIQHSVHGTSIHIPISADLAAQIVDWERV